MRAVMMGQKREDIEQRGQGMAKVKTRKVG